jgi:hypothetical protein
MRVLSNSCAILLLAVILLCGRLDVTNPHDSTYDGDYRLSIGWDTLPDTLEIFRLYRIAWHHAGTDTFATVRVVPPRSGVIDTTLLAAGLESTITLYFIDTLQGPMTVRGVRPNNRTVDTTHRVIVINPYSIAGESRTAAGDSINLSISTTIGGRNTGLKTIWSLDGTAIDTLGIDTAFTLSQASNSVRRVGAILLDESKHTAALAFKPIEFRGRRPALDSVVAGPNVALDDSLSMRVYLQDADATPLRVFVSDSIGRHDSTAVLGFGSPLDIRIKAFANDTGSMQFKVYVRDTTGLASGNVTQTLRITHVRPTIAFFSDTIVCNRGDSTTINAGIRGGSFQKVYWRFNDGDADTTQTASLKRAFDSTVTLAIVWCVDRFGYRSMPDSAIIAAKPFDYKLTWIQKPEHAAARRPIVCSVAIDSSGRFVQRKGSISWRIYNGQETVTDTSGSALTSLAMRFNDSANIRIAVRAIDFSGESAAPLEAVFAVRENHPTCAFVKDKDSTRIGKELTVLLRAADPLDSGRVDSIFWDLGNDGVLDKAGTAADSTLAVRYDKPGAYQICAWAKDNDGFVSARDTITILARADRPYFAQPHADSILYIGSTATMRAPAKVGESGIPVVMWYWRIVGSNPRNDSVKVDSINHTFANHGSDTVIVLCQDADGMFCAAPDTFVVTVDPGRPVAIALFRDSVWMRDTVVYEVRGSDPNGSVVSWAVRWEAGQPFELRADGHFTHAYPDTGSYTLATFVVDTDGISGDTVAKRVFVKLGAPTIDSINPDSALNTLYINDPVTWRVKGRDSNDRVDSVLVSWDSDNTFEARAKAVDNSAAFTYTFPRFDSGSRTIRFRVKDNDGLTCDSTLTVTVRAGAPSVTHAWCERETVWVNDANRYRVTATDPNGFIRAIYANGEGGASARDTIAVAGSRAFIDTCFTHVYDTTGGPRIARFWALDEDGVVSAIYDTSFIVHKGAPVVSGADGDTVWVVVDKGSGENYTLHVRSMDTNGVIQRFYWHEAATFDSTSGSCVKTADSTRTRLIGALEVNHGWQSWIFARDDDGFVRGNRFVVFADSAPPMPQPYNPVAGTLDTVTLRWSNYDLKDGRDSTLFEVYVGYGGAAPTTLLYSVKGALYGWDGSRYLYKFKPTQASFSWKIRAIDTRKTASDCSRQDYAP